jgi:hypothetical protein
MREPGGSPAPSWKARISRLLGAGIRTTNYAARLLGRGDVGASGGEGGGGDDEKSANGTTHDLPRGEMVSGYASKLSPDHVT